MNVVTTTSLTMKIINIYENSTLKVEGGIIVIIATRRKLKDLK